MLTQVCLPKDIVMVTVGYIIANLVTFVKSKALEFTITTDRLGVCRPLDSTIPVDDLVAASSEALPIHVNDVLGVVIIKKVTLSSATITIVPSI